MTYGSRDEKQIRNEYNRTYQHGAGEKGILAMDESNQTCNKRFAQYEIPPTEEARLS